MQVKLNNVRLAFPALFEPQVVKGDTRGKPAFSAQLILPRDHPQLPEIEKAIIEAATQTWGAKAMDVLRSLKPQDKLCVHNGDAKAEWSGFPGNLFISARAEARPLVVDRNRNILTAADGKVYAGCYVNAVLDIWAQDNQFGRRVNAGLKGVQFYAEGEAFGGSVPAQVDDFDDLDAGSIGGGSAGGGSLF
jgi:hypothetical protein